MELLKEIVYGVLCTHVLILCFVGYGVWLEIYNTVIEPWIHRKWQDMSSE
jgi:hypothetical protein